MTNAIIYKGFYIRESILNWDGLLLCCSSIRKERVNNCDWLYPRWQRALLHLPCKRNKESWDHIWGSVKERGLWSTCNINNVDPWISCGIKRDIDLKITVSRWCVDICSIHEVPKAEFCSCESKRVFRITFKETILTYTLVPVPEYCTTGEKNWKVSPKQAEDSAYIYLPLPGTPVVWSAQGPVKTWGQKTTVHQFKLDFYWTHD